MRTNSIILVALLTLAGLGAGMILGGRLGSPRAATVPSPSTSAAAEAWLAKVNLPDDRKQRLLARP